MHNFSENEITRIVQEAIERGRAAAGLQPDLLLLETVASMLGVQRITVKRLVESGDLPVVMIGREMRFNPRDIQEFVRRNTSPHPLPEQPERISL